MTIPRLQGSSAAVRVMLIAVVWLGTISFLHAFLNRERTPPNKVLMGYMPVITNLAAPLIDAASEGTEIRFEAVKFGSFAEMGEAFRSGHIQVAFIIAPLAIVMHHQGVPLKVVYIGNRHESTLVVANSTSCKDLSEMEGKTVAVPIRFSGHFLAVKRYLRQNGLDSQSIRLLEIAPPDMASALAAKGIDGYFVGEPFASKTLHNGAGRRLLDVESIWPNFICNLVIVREELIRNRPQWVQRLVTGAVRSGFWARDHIDETVKLVSKYWGQDPEVVRYAFSNPPNRIRFDLYMPVLDELEEIASEMQKAGLINNRIEVGGMMDNRFAKAVNIDWNGSYKDIFSQ